MGQVVPFTVPPRVDSFDVERRRTDLAARVCRMDASDLLRLERAIDSWEPNERCATGVERDPEPSQLLFLPVSTIV